MSRNSFGYTMVEVMVVLLILGIVAAVAVPPINGALDEIKIDGAAREVISAIYYCQSLAIKEGESHQMNFNVMQDKFFCQEMSTTTTVLHPVDKKPYEIKSQNEGPFQGVEIVSVQFNPGNQSSVFFNSLGEPNKFGTIVIGYGGLQKTINVSLPLGNVSVN